MYFPYKIQLDILFMDSRTELSIYGNFYQIKNGGQTGQLQSLYAGSLTHSLAPIEWDPPGESQDQKVNAIEKKTVLENKCHQA